MQTATLRLFNAIQVNDRAAKFRSRDTLERSIRNGYILDPAVRANDVTLETIESIIGISGEKANAAFHKSWAVVRDTPMEILVTQQILHYITTYGFEALGVFRDETVFIPHEVLGLPQIKESIPLTVIKAMTGLEILGAIISLGSGIALSQETLDDIMVFVKAGDYNGGFVAEIGNRELRALLYDFYGLVPIEPTEFLRYLINKLTGESLLIKNNFLIEKIKGSDSILLDALLEDAPNNLASIFFRFKPLFLAMKIISGNKTFFNRLRKDANRLHRPMPEDYLNSVTAQIKGGRLDTLVLAERLERASVFRKIRLAYALEYRLSPGDSIVYRVRNGRGWVTGFEWPAGLKEQTQRAQDIVLMSITSDIRENVEGKTIYIPPNVHYALPATEKQFTGHLPTGSFVSVPEDLIVGIHWQNTDKRVDLDLSVISGSGKIGWDASYRSGSRDALFSGDVTDAPAPLGASELLYLKRSVREPKVLMVNYFNFDEGDQVECKIIVAHEQAKSLDKNYMVDVSNIVATANITLAKRQAILGLVAENRVYFANVSVGNSITSVNNDQATGTRRFLEKSLTSSLRLGDVLAAAGAVVVDERPSGEYVDLSPEALDKTTIIDLITK